ncbi:helix-turn-helix domain-containing protein [Variovorax sp. GT1P44]|uniref:helix-turn-helix domain-containing protein n=1 Tax=Variovorax sp. GT1P44 TaxID=3443742 RepID=UPI003F455E56
MTYKLSVFHDFHLHGASAPEWNQRYAQMTRGAMRSSLAEVTAGSLHVFRKWMSERVVQQGCLPKGKICFAVLNGAAAGTPRMQGREVRADTLFVLRGGEEFSLQRPRDMELLAVTFEADEFLRLLDERPLSPAARALLSRSHMQAPLPYLRRLRRQALGAFRAPIASQAIFQSIADLAEHATGAPQSVGSASASYVVAQCHQIVARSTDEPPGIEALCARLRTSRRTLQNSFRQVSDTTAVHYLRCVRLDAARRLLLSTGPGDISVAQAAMRCGFTHLGHFTGQYRALFGELPSQTLRSRLSPARRSPAR